MSPWIGPIFITRNGLSSWNVVSEKSTKDSESFQNNSHVCCCFELGLCCSMLVSVQWRNVCWNHTEALFILCFYLSECEVADSPARPSLNAVKPSRIVLVIVSIVLWPMLQLWPWGHLFFSPSDTLNTNITLCYLTMQPWSRCSVLKGLKSFLGWRDRLVNRRQKA